MTLAELRAQAVARSLFAPMTLAPALARLGFVQADPIRAPARAQDLILRQRVAGYRAGDLERAYPRLAVEEDLLYAYGFLAREAWTLLHPRKTRKLSRLEASVLARVRAEGPTHPRVLQPHFGGARVVNAWGGSSKATTVALERLHHLGHLRIARRERGLRVYEAASAVDDAGSPDERLRGLLRLVAGLLAPVDEKTLSSIAAYLRRFLPATREQKLVIADLARAGELERHVVDGRAYLAPPGRAEPGEPSVRFLAPFDPLVWDRRRFEQLWGWAYRFEAYTPVAKRVRGYYALPLLWGERVIGWANVTREEGVDVQLGFVEKRPRGKDFTRELDAEIARLEAFLAGE